MSSLKSKRPLIIGITLSVVFVIVYLFAIVAYSNSGKSVVESRPPASENGVEAQIDVVNIDPLRHELTVRVALLPSGDFAAEDSSFKYPMRVKYFFTTGESSTEPFDIPKGQFYSLNELKFLTYGNFDAYPIDVFSPSFASDQEALGRFPVPLFEVSLLDDKGQEIPVGQGGNVPIIQEEEIGAPHGWRSTWNIAVSDNILFWDYTLKRSGGTLVFVAVVMILMAVLAVAALSVSIRVFRKPGTIEATMASWQAALLFALIPLRNFLPGSPPIGAWIDVLVFYWVILALMCSMALFTYTWLRDKGHLPGEKKSKVAVGKEPASK